jgi:hypothetical protein
VFENRVLRKVFGAKRDEVTGEWRKLHNTQYCAGGQIEKNEMGGACGAYWKRRRVYRFVVGKKDNLKDTGLYGRIILRWILR